MRQPARSNALLSLECSRWPLDGPSDTVLNHAPCIAPLALPLSYGDLEIKALDAEDPNGSQGARALSYVVDDGAKTFRLTPADLISALEEYREMMEATELHEVRRS